MRSGGEASNFEGCATVISGSGDVCSSRQTGDGVRDVGAPKVVVVVVGNDNGGDLQFFNQRSGVISPAVVESSPIRWGCISKCARVSRQKICILYWFRHLSEQNCNCDAPS